MHNKIVPLLQIAFLSAVIFVLFVLYRLICRISVLFAFFVVLCLFLLFLYAYFVEPNILTVNEIHLAFPDYPLERPIRILQISDLHYNSDALIYRKMLEAIKNIEPDIIVITGDFIGEWGRAEGVYRLLNEIGGLGIPTFAVLGNWDHHKTANGIEEVIRKANITLLMNENIEFQEGFYITGTDDPYFGYADLEKTFKGIPHSAFTVLLTHAPDIIYEAAKYSPQLVLCGHTHGGQVKVPFIKAIYVPSEYGTRFLEGLFNVNGVYMYVNRGIGESHLRMRFLSPPEITVFTINRKE